MKIFVPCRRYEPSGCGRARAATAPRSEPACGSVRFMVPVQSPEAIWGRYSAFCSSVPCALSMLMAPWVSSGHSDHDMQAEVNISSTASPTRWGKPPPP